MSIISKKDAFLQLYKTRTDVSQLLEGELSIDRGIKVEETRKVLMKKKKIDENGEVSFIFSEPYFNCNVFTIYNEYEIRRALDRADEEIKNRIATWLSEGSGWVIKEIQHHWVNIVKHVPLRGRSYLPLPKELRNSMYGSINLKNDDNKCFLCCHVRHLKPQKTHPERIKLEDREFAKRLDYSGITFPVTVEQIPKIEKQNKININLFSYDNGKKSVYPISVSKEKHPDHIELLYIEGQYEGKERQHYVYIKDFSRLMYNFTKHKAFLYELSSMFLFKRSISETQN